MYLKIAFFKMLSQFASDFTLDLGDVVGYIDQIQRKIWCEVGRQIAGMNFQTRSSIIHTNYRYVSRRINFQPARPAERSHAAVLFSKPTRQMSE